MTTPIITTTQLLNNIYTELTTKPFNIASFSRTITELIQDSEHSIDVRDLKSKFGGHSILDYSLLINNIDAVKYLVPLGASFDTPHTETLQLPLINFLLQPYTPPHIDPFTPEHLDTLLWLCTTQTLTTVPDFGETLAFLKRISAFPLTHTHASMFLLLIQTFKLKRSTMVQLTASNTQQHNLFHKFVEFYSSIDDMPPPLHITNPKRGLFKDLDHDKCDLIENDNVQQNNDNSNLNNNLNDNNNNTNTSQISQLERPVPTQNRFYIPNKHTNETFDVLYRDDIIEQRTPFYRICEFFLALEIVIAFNLPLSAVLYQTRALQLADSGIHFEPQYPIPKSFFQGNDFDYQFYKTSIEPSLRHIHTLQQHLNDPDMILPLKNLTIDENNTTTTTQSQKPRQQHATTRLIPYINSDLSAYYFSRRIHQQLLFKLPNYHYIIFLLSLSFPLHKNDFLKRNQILSNNSEDNKMLIQFPQLARNPLLFLYDTTIAHDVDILPLLPTKRSKYGHYDHDVSYDDSVQIIDNAVDKATDIDDGDDDNNDKNEQSSTKDITLSTNNESSFVSKIKLNDQDSHYLGAHIPSCLQEYLNDIINSYPLAPDNDPSYILKPSNDKIISTTSRTKQNINNNSPTSALHLTMIEHLFQEQKFSIHKISTQNFITQLYQTSFPITNTTLLIAKAFISFGFNFIPSFENVFKSVLQPQHIGSDTPLSLLNVTKAINNKHTINSNNIPPIALLHQSTRVKASYIPINTSQNGIVDGVGIINGPNRCPLSTDLVPMQLPYNCTPLTNLTMPQVYIPNTKQFVLAKSWEGHYDIAEYCRLNNIELTNDYINIGTSNNRNNNDAKQDKTGPSGGNNNEGTNITTPTDNIPLNMLILDPTASNNNNNNNNAGIIAQNINTGQAQSFSTTPDDEMNEGIFTPLPLPNLTPINSMENENTNPNATHNTLLNTQYNPKYNYYGYNGDYLQESLYENVLFLINLSLYSRSQPYDADPDSSNAINNKDRHPDEYLEYSFTNSMLRSYQQLFSQIFESVYLSLSLKLHFVYNLYLTFHYYLAISAGKGISHYLKRDSFGLNLPFEPNINNINNIGAGTAANGMIYGDINAKLQQIGAINHNFPPRGSHLYKQLEECAFLTNTVTFIEIRDQINPILFKFFYPFVAAPSNMQLYPSQTSNIRPIAPVMTGGTTSAVATTINSTQSSTQSTPSSLSLPTMTPSLSTKPYVELPDPTFTLKPIMQPTLSTLDLIHDPNTIPITMQALKTFPSNTRIIDNDENNNDFDNKLNGSDLTQLNLYEREKRSKLQQQTKILSAIHEPDSILWNTIPVSEITMTTHVCLVNTTLSSAMCGSLLNSFQNLVTVTPAHVFLLLTCYALIDSMNSLPLIPKFPNLHLIPQTQISSTTGATVTTMIPNTDPRDQLDTSPLHTLYQHYIFTPELFMKSTPYINVAKTCSKLNILAQKLMENPFHSPLYSTETLYDHRTGLNQQIIVPLIQNNLINMNNPQINPGLGHFMQKLGIFFNVPTLFARYTSFTPTQSFLILSSIFSNLTNISDTGILYMTLVQIVIELGVGPKDLPSFFHFFLQSALETIQPMKFNSFQLLSFHIERILSCAILLMNIYRVYKYHCVHMLIDGMYQDWVKRYQIAYDEMKNNKESLGIIKNSPSTLETTTITITTDDKDDKSVDSTPIKPVKYAFPANNILSDDNTDDVFKYQRELYEDKVSKMNIPTKKSDDEALFNNTNEITSPPFTSSKKSLSIPALRDLVCEQFPLQLQQIEDRIASTYQGFPVIGVSPRLLDLYLIICAPIFDSPKFSTLYHWLSTDVPLPDIIHHHNDNQGLNTGLKGYLYAKESLNIANNVLDDECNEKHPLLEVFITQYRRQQRQTLNIPSQSTMASKNNSNFVSRPQSGQNIHNIINNNDDGIGPMISNIGLNVSNTPSTASNSPHIGATITPLHLPPSVTAHAPVMASSRAGSVSMTTLPSLPMNTLGVVNTNNNQDSAQQPPILSLDITTTAPVSTYISPQISPSSRNLRQNPNTFNLSTPTNSQGGNNNKNNNNINNNENITSLSRASSTKSHHTQPSDLPIGLRNGFVLTPSPWINLFTSIKITTIPFLSIIFSIQTPLTFNDILSIPFPIGQLSSSTTTTSLSNLASGSTPILKPGTYIPSQGQVFTTNTNTNQNTTTNNINISTPSRSAHSSPRLQPLSPRYNDVGPSSRASFTNTLPSGNNPTPPITSNTPPVNHQTAPATTVTATTTTTTTAAAATRPITPSSNSKRVSGTYPTPLQLGTGSININQKETNVVTNTSSVQNEYQNISSTSLSLSKIQSNIPNQQPQQVPVQPQIEMLTLSDWARAETLWDVSSYVSSNDPLFDHKAELYPFIFKNHNFHDKLSIFDIPADITYAHNLLLHTEHFWPLNMFLLKQRLSMIVKVYKDVSDVLLTKKINFIEIDRDLYYSHFKIPPQPVLPPPTAPIIAVGPLGSTPATKIPTTPQYQEIEDVVHEFDGEKIIFVENLFTILGISSSKSSQINKIIRQSHAPQTTTSTSTTSTTTTALPIRLKGQKPISLPPKDTFDEIKRPQFSQFSSLIHLYRDKSEDFNIMSGLLVGLSRGRASDLPLPFSDITNTSLFTPFLQYNPYSALFSPNFHTTLPLSYHNAISNQFGPYLDHFMSILPQNMFNLITSGGSNLTDYIYCKIILLMFSFTFPNLNTTLNAQAAVLFEKDGQLMQKLNKNDILSIIHKDTSLLSIYNNILLHDKGNSELFVTSLQNKINNQRAHASQYLKNFAQNAFFGALKSTFTRLFHTLPYRFTYPLDIVMDFYTGLNEQHCVSYLYRVQQGQFGQNNPNVNATMITTTTTTTATTSNNGPTSPYFGSHNSPPIHTSDSQPSTTTTTTTTTSGPSTVPILHHQSSINKGNAVTRAFKSVLISEKVVKKNIEKWINFRCFALIPIAAIWVSMFFGRGEPAIENEFSAPNVIQDDPNHGLNSSEENNNNPQSSSSSKQLDIGAPGNKIITATLTMPQQNQQQQQSHSQIDLQISNSRRFNEFYLFYLKNNLELGKYEYIRRYFTNESLDDELSPPTTNTGAKSNAIRVNMQSNIGPIPQKMTHHKEDITEDFHGLGPSIGPLLSKSTTKLQRNQFDFAISYPTAQFEHHTWLHIGFLINIYQCRPNNRHSRLFHQSTMQSMNPLHVHFERQKMVNNPDLSLITTYMRLIAASYSSNPLDYITLLSRFLSSSSSSLNKGTLGQVLEHSMNENMNLSSSYMSGLIPSGRNSPKLNYNQQQNNLINFDAQNGDNFMLENTNNNNNDNDNPKNERNSQNSFKIDTKDVQNRHNTIAEPWSDVWFGQYNNDFFKQILTTEGMLTDQLTFFYWVKKAVAEQNRMLQYYSFQHNWSLAKECGKQSKHLNNDHDHIDTQHYENFSNHVDVVDDDDELNEIDHFSNTNTYEEQVAYLTSRNYKSKYNLGNGIILDLNDLAGLYSIFNTIALKGMDEMRKINIKNHNNTHPEDNNDDDEGDEGDMKSVSDNEKLQDLDEVDFDNDNYNSNADDNVKLVDEIMENELPELILPLNFDQIAMLDNYLYQNASNSTSSSLMPSLSSTTDANIGVKTQISPSIGNDTTDTDEQQNSISITNPFTSASTPLPAFLTASIQYDPFGPFCTTVHRISPDSFSFSPLLTTPSYLSFDQPHNFTGIKDAYMKLQNPVGLNTGPISMRPPRSSAPITTTTTTTTTSTTTTTTTLPSTSSSRRKKSRLQSHLQPPRPSPSTILLAPRNLPKTKRVAAVQTRFFFKHSPLGTLFSNLTPSTSLHSIVSALLDSHMVDIRQLSWESQYELHRTSAYNGDVHEASVPIYKHLIPTPPQPIESGEHWSPENNGFKQTPRIDPLSTVLLHSSTQNLRYCTPRDILFEAIVSFFCFSPSAPLAPAAWTNNMDQNSLYNDNLNGFDYNNKKSLNDDNNNNNNTNNNTIPSSHIDTATQLYKSQPSHHSQFTAICIGDASNAMYYWSYSYYIQVCFDIILLLFTYANKVNFKFDIVSSLTYLLTYSYIPLTHPVMVQLVDFLLKSHLLQISTIQAELQAISNYITSSQRPLYQFALHCAETIDENLLPGQGQQFKQQLDSEINALIENEQTVLLSNRDNSSSSSLHGQKKPSKFVSQNISKKQYSRSDTVVHITVDDIPVPIRLQNAVTAWELMTKHRTFTKMLNRYCHFSIHSNSLDTIASLPSTLLSRLFSTQLHSSITSTGSFSLPSIVPILGNSIIVDKITSGYIIQNNQNVRNNQNNPTFSPNTNPITNSGLLQSRNRPNSGQNIGFDTSYNNFNLGQPISNQNYGQFSPLLSPSARTRVKPRPGPSTRPNSAGTHPSSPSPQIHSQHDNNNRPNQNQQWGSTPVLSPLSPSGANLGNSVLEMISSNVYSHDQNRKYFPTQRLGNLYNPLVAQQYAQSSALTLKTRLGLISPPKLHNLDLIKLTKNITSNIFFSSNSLPHIGLPDLNLMRNMYRLITQINYSDWRRENTMDPVFVRDFSVELPDNVRPPIHFPATSWHIQQLANQNKPKSHAGGNLVFKDLTSSTFTPIQSPLVQAIYTIIASNYIPVVIEHQDVDNNNNNDDNNIVTMNNNTNFNPAIIDNNNNSFDSNCSLIPSINNTTTTYTSNLKETSKHPCTILLTPKIAHFSTRSHVYKQCLNRFSFLLLSDLFSIGFSSNQSLYPSPSYLSSIKPDWDTIIKQYKNNNNHVQKDLIQHQHISSGSTISCSNLVEKIVDSLFLSRNINFHENLFLKQAKEYYRFIHSSQFPHAAALYNTAIPSNHANTVDNMLFNSIHSLYHQQMIRTRASDKNDLLSINLIKKVDLLSPTTFSNTVNTLASRLDKYTDPLTTSNGCVFVNKNNHHSILNNNNQNNLSQTSLDLSLLKTNSPQKPSSFLGSVAETTLFYQILTNTGGLTSVYSNVNKYPTITAFFMQFSPEIANLVFPFLKTLRSIVDPDFNNDNDYDDNNDNHSSYETSDSSQPIDLTIGSDNATNSKHSVHIPESTNDYQCNDTLENGAHDDVNEKALPSPLHSPSHISNFIISNPSETSSFTALVSSQTHQQSNNQTIPAQYDYVDSETKSKTDQNMINTAQKNDGNNSHDNVSNNESDNLLLLDSTNHTIISHFGNNNTNNNTHMDHQTVSPSHYDHDNTNNNSDNKQLQNDPHNSIIFLEKAKSTVHKHIPMHQRGQSVTANPLNNQNSHVNRQSLYNNTSSSNINVAHAPIHDASNDNDNTSNNTVYASNRNYQHKRMLSPTIPLKHISYTDASGQTSFNYRENSQNSDNTTFNYPSLSEHIHESDNENDDESDRIIITNDPVKPTASSTQIITTTSPTNITAANVSPPQVTNKATNSAINTLLFEAFDTFSILPFFKSVCKQLQSTSFTAQYSPLVNSKTSMTSFGDLDAYDQDSLSMINLVSIHNALYITQLSDYVPYITDNATIWSQLTKMINNSSPSKPENNPDGAIDWGYVREVFAFQSYSLRELAYYRYFESLKSELEFILVGNKLLEKELLLIQQQQDEKKRLDSNQSDLDQIDVSDNQINVAMKIKEELDQADDFLADSNPLQQLTPEQLKEQKIQQNNQIITTLFTILSNPPQYHETTPTIHTHPSIILFILNNVVNIDLDDFVTLLQCFNDELYFSPQFEQKSTSSSSSIPLTDENSILIHQDYLDHKNNVNDNNNNIVIIDNSTTHTTTTDIANNRVLLYQYETNTPILIIHSLLLHQYPASYIKFICNWLQSDDISYILKQSYMLEVGGPSDVHNDLDDNHPHDLDSIAFVDDDTNGNDIGKTTWDAFGVEQLLSSFDLNSTNPLSLNNNNDLLKRTKSPKSKVYISLDIWSFIFHSITPPSFASIKNHYHQYINNTNMFSDINNQNNNSTNHCNSAQQTRALTFGECEYFLQYFEIIQLFVTTVDENRGQL